MPQLDLSDIECKALWLIADAGAPDLSPELDDAAVRALAKVYRAYRGMPPAREGFRHEDFVGDPTGAPTKHVCGLRGYDPMRDPPCPACGMPPQEAA